MGYLIFQTLLLLLAAFIIGCIIGCWLKRTFGASDAACDAIAPNAASSSSDASDGRPEALAAPVGGAKDDLKKIKGVGRVIEGKLNDLGIFHFSQIAGWAAEEVSWVDGYLSFKGRIKRDTWIKQAKLLADGKETEFSKRVDKGSVSRSR